MLFPKTDNPCGICDNPDNQIIRNGKVQLCLTCFLEDNRDRPRYYKVLYMLDQMKQIYNEKAAVVCSNLGHPTPIDIKEDPCMDGVRFMHILVADITSILDDVFPKPNKEPYEPHMKEDGE